eukprot:CAMPEP_0171971764 /NCGR_PEP_ID=MMETSP0993-20121228/219441_1 /TAXON_ID=483369 /ORGANISM="non described non described, Strain CCMP2098" /LENGTH=42 /DNA_ID= /DNA_START= /DNA_END= /DNA_ORIENTATION=
MEWKQSSNDGARVGSIVTDGTVVGTFVGTEVGAGAGRLVIDG